jgi:hypothetical protein
MLLTYKHFFVRVLMSDEEDVDVEWKEQTISASKIFFFFFFFFK